MAKCNLAVITENNKQDFQLGEVIRGEVIVTVDTSVKCKRIRLVYEWSTHGKGNCDSRTIDKLQLSARTLEPGTYRYPFNFVIPQKEQVSYYGKYVSISHFLKVTADIPWAIDPKATTQIRVISDNQAVQITPEHIQDEMKTLEKDKNISLIVSVIALVITAYSLLFFQLAAKVIVVVIALFVLHTLFRSYKELQTAKVLGPMIILTNYIPEGNLIAFNFKLEPNESFILEDLYAQLVFTEIAVSGSGTNETTYTETYVIDEINLTSGEQVEANSLHEFKGQLRLPKDMATSFNASKNSLNWSIVFELEAEKFSHTLTKDFFVKEA